MSQLMRALVLILTLALFGVGMSVVGCGKMFKSTVTVEADESMDSLVLVANAYLAAQTAPVASPTESIVAAYLSNHTPLQGAIVPVSSCSAVLGITVKCLVGRLDLNRAEITIGVVISGSTMTYPLLAIHARFSTLHCFDARYFPNTLVRIGGGEPDAVLRSNNSAEEIILDSSHPAIGDVATLVVEIDPEGLPMLPYWPDVYMKFFVLELRVYDQIAMGMTTVESRYVASGWIQFLEPPR